MNTAIHSQLTKSLAVGLFFFAISACTASRVANKPWVEAQSQNFHLLSTLDAADTLNLGQELERFRELTETISSVEVAPSAVPTRLMILNGASEFGPFSPGQGVVGYFRPGLRRNYIVLNGAERSTEAKQVIYHEYVHYFLNESQAEYPWWYEEGLAEFLSTARIKDGVAEIGRPPARAGLVALKRGVTVVDNAAATGSHIRKPSTAAAADLDYAKAWAMVDFFTLGHVASQGAVDRREALGRYLVSINEGASDEPAFEKAFGASFDKINQQIMAYVRADEYPLAKINTSKAAALTADQIQPVAPATIACELGELSLTLGKIDQAQTFFQQALTAEPKSGRATAGLAIAESLKDQGAQATSRFERALELAPKDPTIQMDYADHLARTAEKIVGKPDPQARHAIIETARAHYRRAIELDSRTPAAYAQLGASYLLEDGDVRPGIQALGTALAMLPRAAWIHLKLARLYLMANDREQTRKHLDAVLRISEEGTLADEARKILLELSSR